MTMWDERVYKVEGKNDKLDERYYKAGEKMTVWMMEIMKWMRKMTLTSKSTLSSLCLSPQGPYFFPGEQLLSLLLQKGREEGHGALPSSVL